MCILNKYLDSNTCFRMKKGRGTFFRPETIVASFLHSMVLLPKVLFNHFLMGKYENVAFILTSCIPHYPSNNECYYHNLKIELRFVLKHDGIPFLCLGTSVFENTTEVILACQE